MSFNSGQDHDFSAGDTITRGALAALASYEPPAGEAEAAIATMWARALGIDRVGRNDDFFDLGGDSYAATEIAAEVEERFGVAFSPANIVDNSTVAKQARFIARRAGNSPNSNAPSCLVGYHLDGRRLPLFLIHGANGFTFFNRFFLEFLGKEQPIYLFHAPGFDGAGSTFETFEELAAIYKAAMQSIQPIGPYNIASICNGAYIGLEMSIQLREQGEEVRNLILIDPPQVPRKIAKRYPPTSKKNFQWLGMLQSRVSRKAEEWRNFLASRGFVFGSRNRDGKRPARLILKWRKRFRRELDALRLQEKISEKELTFQANDIINARLALKIAAKNYAPKKPYEGHAHILVNSVYGLRTVRDDLFWKNHLGSFDYEVGHGTHSDFFNKNIALVADFIKRNIDN
jgi:thioesterase domain-containing protein/acyl carrier protein